MAQGYYAGETDEPPVYVLQRATDENSRDKPGSYLLLRSFSYVDRAGNRWTLDASDEDPIETDLASIPTLASWLVPKDGSHTPAALVHDTMVLGEGERVRYRPCDPLVSREEADRLFREGMQFLGVRFLRRWMMWAAVSIPTFFRMPGRALRLRQLLIAVGLAVFVVIGLFGVPDVFDVPGSVKVWSWVPLVGGRTLAWSLLGVEEASFLGKVLRFLGVAVAVTAVYALAWRLFGHRWRFGLVIGVALSLMSFPLFITGVAFLVYAAVEEVVAFVLLRLRRRDRYRGRVRASQATERLSKTL